MEGTPKLGLLVMAYGTPASSDDIEAYYTHIRRGRPPSPEQLADLRGRYEAIGGASPLAERTRDQARALATELERHQPGAWRVTLGNKHAPPFVEDGVAVLAGQATGEELGPTAVAEQPAVAEARPAAFIEHDAGTQANPDALAGGTGDTAHAGEAEDQAGTGRAPVEHIVGLVLAPHWSRASVGEYHERAGAAASDHGIAYHGIEAWHDEPAWRDALAQRVREARGALPEATKVLFTAHSLPERVLAGDPYEDQLWTSAAAIAGRAGVNPWYGWALAWQSAGRTPEPWRGPDVAEVIRQLGDTGRADGVLVCPQGFVSDHLEVLYDLDVDAARVAAEAGLAFGRTASINDDAEVMSALAARVRRAVPR